jgi:hypothetical protein
VHPWFQLSSFAGTSLSFEVCMPTVKEKIQKVLQGHQLLGASPSSYY